MFERAVGAFDAVLGLCLVILMIGIRFGRVSAQMCAGIRKEISYRLVTSNT
jgi:hypothetical protein